MKRVSMAGNLCLKLGGSRIQSSGLHINFTQSLQMKNGEAVEISEADNVGIILDENKGKLFNV